MIKKSGLAFLLLFSSTVAFAEECPLERLAELEYEDIHCQFYLGTMAYRSKLYGVAAAHWQYVIGVDAKHPGEEAIRAMALGTLNFLTYYGLGVAEDKQSAVNQWKQAAKGGSLEARRHLGFAYSDQGFEGYDLVRSLAWYKSIFLLHSGQAGLDAADADILTDAREESKAVESQLTPTEVLDASNMAVLLAK